MKETESIDKTAHDGAETGNDDSLASKLNIISNLIKLGKFEKALTMLQVLVDLHPEAPEFKYAVHISIDFLIAI